MSFCCLLPLLVLFQNRIHKYCSFVPGHKQMEFGVQWKPQESIQLWRITFLLLHLKSTFELWASPVTVQSVTVSGVGTTTVNTVSSQWHSVLLILVFSVSLSVFYCCDSSSLFMFPCPTLTVPLFTCSAGSSTCSHSKQYP